MIDHKTGLTSGRHLTRNIFWNLLGSGAPLLVAIVAIPVLINGMGLARFGVLTIAWMVVGYFSLFDLGLGRALTKLVAEKLGNSHKAASSNEIPALIWTAMLLMAVLGVVGAVIVASISPWLVGRVLNIPAALQPETLLAFYLLAAAVPIVISSAGLRGVLEAHQRFGLVNAVRIPLGISIFLGPVLVLPFSNSLAPVVAVLVFARLVSWCAYIVLCLYVEPGLRHSMNINRGLIKPLLSFGGWMTVSNIVSPLMVYLDRFLIGAVISMAAVSFYATPYEIVSRLLIIPGALMGVMFPAFAATFVQDRKRAAYLYGRVIKYIFLLLFPIVLIIVTLAYDGLNLWLGSDFAGNSYRVLQLLAVGVLINALANVPFGLLQSAGRPDLTAKLHVAELPFYLLILWWLLNAYGIVGVAIAWVLRVVVDTIVLFIMANKLLQIAQPYVLRTLLMVGVVLFILVVGVQLSEISTKGLFILLTLCIFTITTWFVILSSQEKCIIRDQLKAVLSS
jgi:O-antigen/teichoic acid export membrane protein